MFDGTVPVNLERLKEIYRSVDQLSLKLGAFNQEAYNEGLPKSFQEKIQALEDYADEIKALFDGILTEAEREKLIGIKPKRRKRRPRPLF